MVNREELISGTRPEVGNRILMTASDHFDGYQIVHYNGMVWGISIRSKDVGTDILMGCKQTFGGELTSFTELADEGRQRAVDRMLDMAARLGANAIINFRFNNENITGLTEVTAYATAVVIKPIQNYVPVGAVGNILADMADVMTGTTQNSPETSVKPVLKQNKYPLASLKLSSGKVFTVCPQCKTIYNSDLISEKTVRVRGYGDCDATAEGQQIKCDNCAIVFSVPAIETE